LLFIQQSTKDVPIVWKGLDLESFLIGIFNVKAKFMVVACIYNHKSFKGLLITMNKSIFVAKIWFEFRQYMARKGEVPFQLMTLWNNLVLMYANLFPCKIGTNVGVHILTSRKLSTLIESLIFCVSRRSTTLQAWGFFRSNIASFEVDHFEQHGLFEYL